MKSETYPLALPSDLLQKARQAADESGLSLADAMRQSLELGLPRLRDQLAGNRITNVPPLPDDIARELYAQPDDDSEDIKRFMAAQAPGVEECRRGKFIPRRFMGPILVY